MIRSRVRLRKIDCKKNFSLLSNLQWNMDDLYGLKFDLSYVHSPQKIYLKFLHVRRRPFLLLNSKKS